jgi:site-specific recombinase XerD
MPNKYVPVPLFDALEHIDSSLETQLTRIKLILPPNIESSAVAADYKHACHFLLAYRGSAETFKSYRREIERLLQWSWFLQVKPLKDLRRNDIETFLQFCQAPSEDWIGVKHVPRFIDKDGLRMANFEWRPFVASISKKQHRDGHVPNIKAYTLSQSALQAIFAVLSSFFNYLEQEDYTFGNPNVRRISMPMEDSDFFSCRVFKTFFLKSVVSKAAMR